MGGRGGRGRVGKSEPHQTWYGDRSTLTCQISSECVHCVRFRWPKTTIFGKFWLFGGSCTNPLLPVRATWCAIADPWCTLMCQISSRSVYSVALCWRKTPIFTVFGLQHLVLSPIGNSLRKLNTGAQLQTFPYPTTSKSFLYSKAFMAKSGAQSLTFKSVTNRQTNRQKNSTFLATRRRVKSEPHRTWHGDKRTSSTFLHL